MVAKKAAAAAKAAVERLTDLLSYAPGSVDCAQLRTAILASREAQVGGTLLRKAEVLLQRAEQLAAEKAATESVHGAMHTHMIGVKGWP